MAPGRLPDGLWRPWGPQGGPSQIFQRFCSSFGGRFGTRKSTKTVSELKLESSTFNIVIFSLLKASWVTVGTHFGIILGCLFGTRAGKANF